MSQSLSLTFEPGTLWEQVKHQTRHALTCGALRPIDTDYEFIDDQGIRFLVRILGNLVRKETANQTQAQARAKGEDFNPFLPYEPDLFVTDLSPTHLCLLNKYNVVDHHILIVTRQFEEQDAWLTQADFHALAACMAEIDGLAFYNGGQLAGASQRHKHLQLIPPPLCPDGSSLPIEPLIQTLSFDQRLCTSPQLPFHHAIIALTLDWQATATELSTRLLTAYHHLIHHVGMAMARPASSHDQPYNLLITRQWMMIVRRSRDQYHSIPINSLGFAGSLLVKSPEQMALLKTLGPMTVLKHVACTPE